MNTRWNAASWPQIMGTIVLMSAVIAAGAYFYVNQRNEEDTVSREPPNPDFTTAPEGGVKVELPTTPMTGRPAAAPVANENASGTAPASPKPAQTSPRAAPANR